MKLFGIPLQPRHYFALWVGVGSLVGLALGAMIGTGGDALRFAPAWGVVTLLYAGSVLWLAKRAAPEAARPAPRAAPAPARAAPPAPPRPAAPAGPLRVAIDLPEIPSGYPPVVGEGEELTVRLRVHHDGAPAEGAAVRLTGRLRDGARVHLAEGVTGEAGLVALLAEPHGTGELILEAEASLDDLRGTATATVSIVRYEEEIERLFGEFRAYALNVLGPEAQSDTARELAERLRRTSDPEAGRALLELARIYELVAYGERTADRRLYLALVGALLTLEGADIDGPGAAKAPGVPVEG